MSGSCSTSIAPAIAGEGAESTLEYAVVVAASLAAALLDSGEQRAVGLLAASGAAPVGSASSEAEWLEKEPFDDRPMNLTHR